MNFLLWLASHHCGGSLAAAHLQWLHAMGYPFRPPYVNPGGVVVLAP